MVKNERLKYAIKMTYGSIGGFEFNQLMEKLYRTPTSSNDKANHIRQIRKRWKVFRTQIVDEYKKEIMEKFAKRDEKGEFVRPPNQPEGFEFPEGIEKELQAATAEFEKREVIFDWRPMTPQTLSDMKLSAHELDTLGALYTDESGPGLPEDFARQMALVQDHQEDQATQ